MKRVIEIDGNNLKLEQVETVARQGAVVELSEDAKRKVIRSRYLIERALASGKQMYGITTGFGELCEVPISNKEHRALQRNLLRSHAAGVGEPLPEDTVRAMMLLRANALAKGYSGIKLETLITLVEMLNRGIYPVVPELGSVGASGDLIPLSHMALVLIGEGEAIYRGRRISAKQAMNQACLELVQLDSKEGLALINGTQAMTALGVLTVWDAINLIRHADIAAAMSLEALQGTPAAFDQRVNQVRAHTGQSVCAEHIRRMIVNSELLENCKGTGIQDAYSLRCIPQVHGASLDTINYVKTRLETEINSATDNPLIFETEGKGDDVEVISCGNFHGQPIALALDFLAIALAELGSISERRVERLNNPSLNSGLPPFLTENYGLNSGFMIAQYTMAALVSENKILASPASVDSISLSASKEDHVSMGMGAARKALQILKNVERILAVEFMVSAQALDFRGNKPGNGTAKALEVIRKYIPPLEEDRILSTDIDRLTSLIRTGEILTGVEDCVGKLLVD